MSLEGKLSNPNPFGLNIWVSIVIGVVIETICNLLILSYAEQIELKIVLITILSLIVITSIVMHLWYRRKRIIEILYDEKKHIDKKERIPLYKLGIKYDLSKNLLLNRITVNRERQVTSINLSGFDLDKLPITMKKLRNIEQIKCKESKLSGLKRVSITMKNIEILELMKTKLANLKDISQLKNLRILKATECGIEDISALTGLTHLEEINLMRNKIINIDALADMKNLRILNLNDNQVRDISVLGKLESLRNITLSLNPINDFKPIIKRKMEDISFSVMYKAYKKKITGEELTKIKNDLVEQFKRVRETHRFSRTIEGGLKDYGYTVSLHGNTVEN